MRVPYDHKKTNHYRMKSLLKNLGPVIILAGVIVLAVYFFTSSNSNTYLWATGLIMLLGLVYHVVINKLLTE
jgi:membrane protein YdbS with pleckstrin-like domain